MYCWKGQFKNSIQIRYSAIDTYKLLCKIVNINQIAFDKFKLKNDKNSVGKILNDYRNFYRFRYIFSPF